MTAARQRVLDLVENGLIWSKADLSRQAGVSTGVSDALPKLELIAIMGVGLERTDIKRAKDVFPTPGGPQKIIECKRPRSIACRRGLHSPNKWF